jgi:ubiquinone/menaquinone biosynthesis C-methylase UbiE
VEIGAGTGLNFAHYPAAADVLAIEPDDSLRSRAQRRVREATVNARVELIEGRARSLPVDSASVDTVVLTFVLCSVREPPAALAEIARILKPCGRVLVLEHSRDRSPRVARWQERAQPAWGVVFGGCQLVRDIPRELERAGFDTRALHDEPLPLPWIVRHGVRGVVTR